MIILDPPVDPAEDPLRTDLIEMIRDKHLANPRNLQVELGPSDVSHPCMRRMAYGMMQVPRCNPQWDPWPSIVGTAVHTYLEGAARHANNVLGRGRWIIESRVDVTPGLSGKSDLYDRDTETVIDWKTCSDRKLHDYRADPGPLYKMQVNLYGHGFIQAGFNVKRVALAFVPRSGKLNDMYLWSDDYSPELAAEGIRRREQVISLLKDLDIEHHPERYQWIPIEPYQCFFCPQWKAETVNPLQCRGVK